MGVCLRSSDVVTACLFFRISNVLANLYSTRTSNDDRQNNYVNDYSFDRAYRNNVWHSSEDDGDNRT